VYREVGLPAGTTPESFEFIRGWRGAGRRGRSVSPEQAHGPCEAARVRRIVHAARRVTPVRRFAMIAAMPRIRPAGAGEAAAISDLTVRSKAHWGYDDAFMARAAPELTVDEAELARLDAIVAEDDDGRVIGIAAIDPDPDPPVLELLFVEPAVIGTGLGGALLRAVLTRAAARGFDQLAIVSDPNAEPFYRAHGAQRVGTERSTATGRDLPLLRIPTGRDGAR
jgi:GNAT superfamily N-acetyltransferase